MGTPFSFAVLAESWGHPFSFAVLSTLLCFLQIFPSILFSLDSGTIYLSYPGTIFRSYPSTICRSYPSTICRSYGAGGAGRINWNDFFFDGVGSIDSLWFIKRHLCCEVANHPPPRKKRPFRTQKTCDERKGGRGS